MNSTLLKHNSIIRFQFFQDVLKSFFKSNQTKFQDALHRSSPVTFHAWNTSESLDHQNILIYQILKNLIQKLNRDVKNQVLNYYNDKYSFFFWKKVKNIYLQKSDEKMHRDHFYKTILPKNSLILLTLEDEIFKIKSGTNPNLTAFEMFIDDLCRSNNAVIFFSLQKFSPDKKNSTLSFSNYKLSKINLDISLHEALEPQHFMVTNSSMSDPIKTGTLDKVLEMMNQGILKMKEIL